MSQIGEYSTGDGAAVDVSSLSPAGRTSTATVPAVSSLTLDFLAWVASGPRTYAEAMEAWRSSCPRLTIWEDAIEDGLVQIESGTGVPLSKTRVILTPRGQALIDGS